MEKKDDFVQMEQQSEVEKAPTPRFIIIDDEPLICSDDEDEIDDGKNIAYTEIATVEYSSDVRDDKANESLTYTDIERVEPSPDVSNSFYQNTPYEPKINTINEQAVVLNTNKRSELEKENIATNVGTVFKLNDKDTEEENKDKDHLNYVDVEQNDATLSDEEIDNT